MSGVIRVKLIDLPTGKRSFRLLIVFVLSAAVFLVSAFTGRLFAARVHEEVPLQQITGVSDRIALTFDVTHGRGKINELLTILEQEGVKATFFVGGTFLNLYPETVRELAKKGHEVGTLGQLIVDLSALPEEEVTSNLLGSQSVLTKTIGGPVRFFRPPYGAASPSVIRAAKAAGMWTITATNGESSANGSSAVLVREVKRSAQAGSIIRLSASDWAPETAESMREILAVFKEKGLRPVPLGQMR